MYGYVCKNETTVCVPACITSVCVCVCVCVCVPASITSVCVCVCLCVCVCVCVLRYVLIMRGWFDCPVKKRRTIHFCYRPLHNGKIKVYITSPSLSLSSPSLLSFPPSPPSLHPSPPSHPLLPYKIPKCGMY